MSNPILHIFIIHDEGLTQRAIRLHGVFQNMRLIAQSIGFRVKPYFVLNPSNKDIGAEQEKRINYDKTGDPLFDNAMSMLSIEILSNYEKHLKAYTMIDQLETKNPNDMYMIIEDDVFLLPSCTNNYAEALYCAFTNKDKWDMLFLGITHMNAKAEAPMSLQDTRSLFKIIPSKEAYLINAQTAKTLIEDLKEPIKFSMRRQLSWYIQTHTSLRVVNPSKQVTLDGSKLGILPSTIHEKNVLLYNAEYMSLVKFLGEQPNIIAENLDSIKKIYETVASLNSPDIMQVYGILLYKAGEYKEAQWIMDEAITCTQTQQGILNSRSELINNVIDMYKNMQSDLPDLLVTKSKYTEVSA
jgi:GR25 family glycosyltransferase involved in LPS biosynthesis